MCCRTIEPSDHRYTPPQYPHFPFRPFDSIHVFQKVEYFVTSFDQTCAQFLFMGFWGNKLILNLLLQVTRITPHSVTSPVDQPWTNCSFFIESTCTLDLQWNSMLSNKILLEIGLLYLVPAYIIRNEHLANTATISMRKLKTMHGFKRWLLFDRWTNMHAWFIEKTKKIVFICPQ